ncbi:response regulator [Salinimicrobium sp. HB62]|uniref:response regulator n=1 Tax=Salinimicrobium sp. HB62 TaxID=3077781 RepID=UPI002D79894A|nr:response regulator [Salinimicrobium sp. HB62]
MRKNYLLSVFGFLLCFAVFSQSSNKSYKSFTDSLANAASMAYFDYDFNRSIEHSLELIEVASIRNDFYNLNHAYNILGVTYEKLEDTTRAQENYVKALEFARSSNNDTLLWYAYNNLGNIYSSNKKTIEKGLNYYRKALEVSSRIPGSDQALTPVMNIAWTYLENHSYNKALPYLQRAWNLFKNSKEEDLLTKSNLNTLFGMYYSGKEDFDLSREYFEVGIEAAEKDTLIAEASFAYEEFAKMLFKSGSFNEAYTALDKHQTFREKIFDKDKQLQRKAVYERFQTEEFKKDLQAAKREQLYKDEVLEKTQQLSVVMVISLIVMFFFVILLFRNNKVRKKLISQLKDKNGELKLAKEEAERLSSLKTRFFSTVSHELRTPLYGVVGLASLLLEENKGKEQEDDLRSLKFSADYLLALINDVLQMNKMEAQLIHLENSSFDMNSLFQGIIKTFENTRKNKCVQLDLEVDPSIPVLVGDSMRLSQIMMNLVGNAVKFTEEGRIWIKAENKSCSNGKCLIYFEVGDTGIGIPQNKQEEIFEEFSQLKTQNLNYQGTGLGLPIVKKLVELFGSKINIQSTEGEGSVFSFTIEFEQGEEAESLKPLGIDISEIEEKTATRILIVDDNRINQVVTRRILEKRDFQCLVANSGEEALEILKSTPLDIVLMDVNMPGMNGMETTVKIREFNSHIPVIALTAVEVGEMKEEILAAGMNDIINKPYDIPQFFNTIFRNLLQPVA